jgi:hypothetical protein
MRLLALVGLTLVVVRGSLFARVRSVWPSLFGCAMCSGFWVGALGTTGFAIALREYRGSVALSADAVTFGGAVSLCATAADFVFAWLDSHTKEPS